MSRSRLVKHNPAFLSREELSATFVVRNRELDLLLGIVRSNTGPVNQHVIVIAPRGMGKTMLVRRLALAIQQDETLCRNWYPVVLPEELYDVAGEGELWLRVLQWVGEQEKDRDHGRLLKHHAALLTEPDDRTLKIQALSALLDFAGQRRLAVVVENLQMLLGEQASDDDAWDLRQTLLNHPELMLISTATTHFGEILNARKANFELFREICLTPLDTAGCQALWQSITGEDLTEVRVRPMEILTGGSPRLLAILADFGAGRPLKELMDNLVVLIDDHTTYFKANVEALPNKERRVFVTLAELWEPSRAKDVAERSRMQVNIVSALLNRLTEKGAVTRVARKGRTHYYQITERLYNIYHLMRLSGSASDRVKALVRCMVPIYGETAIACALARETCQMDGELRCWFVQGFSSILEQTRQKEEVFREILQNTPQAFFDLPEANYLKPLVEAVSLIEKFCNLVSNQEKNEEAVTIYDSVVRQFGNSEGTSALKLVGLALISKGLALESAGKNEEALATYDSVIHRFDDTEDVTLLKLLATALVKRCYLLATSGNIKEALTICESVIHRFGNSKDASLVEQLALAYYIKSWMILEKEEPPRVDQAIEAAETAIHLSPENKYVSYTLANLYGLAGRWPEALAQIQFFANDSELIEQCPDDIINFFVRAAAAGEAGAALRAIEKTVAASRLEPLVAALKITAGEEFKAPQEVMEVAADIVKKIKEAGPQPQTVTPEN